MKRAGEILVEMDGPIARITLHNPDRRNAISADMWDAIARFCDRARNDVDLRAVIIGGSAGTFSAGADISGFEQGRSGNTVGTYDDLVETTVSLIEAIPQVVVASISGHCMGAGASLACACDIRVCARDAFFAVPAARLGLGYDARGIARFIRIFGEPATREIILLASRIAAERAYTLGAVHRLEDAGQVPDVARRLAEQAASLAPLTQRATKAAIRELGERLPPSEAVRKLVAAADASHDYTEGRAAFAEKRAPNFRGR